MMKQIALILTALFIATALQAQSLMECRELARQHYPEIKRYGLIDKTEQYNLSNAARSWIPQISLSAQASWQTTTPSLPEQFKAIMAQQGVTLNGLQKDQYKIAVDVNQNIWDGGLSQANKKLAETEAAEQRATSEVELYDLEKRIDDLYFGILLLDEREKQAHLKISLLKSNLVRIKGLYDNGVAMQSDVDAVEAELLSAEQTLSTVEASRTSFRTMLEIFIGQPLTDGKLQRPDATVIMQKESARPELKLFEAKNNSLEAQKELVNISTRPKFSAFAQAYYGYPSADYFKSMMTTDWKFNAIIGIRATWNISSFYTKSNNLNKIQTAQDQINLQRDIFLFNTNLQTVQEEGEIARLQETVKSDKRIMQLRNSVRKAAEAKIENGIINTHELLQKITEENMAMLNYSIHEIELLQIIYSLKHTLNQ